MANYQRWVNNLITNKAMSFHHHLSNPSTKYRGSIAEIPIECNKHQCMVVVTVYEDGSKRCNYPDCPFGWRCMPMSYEIIS